MPSGKTAQPEIIDNKDGTVTVKFAPTEPGLHEMHIKYNGDHIPGPSWPPSLILRPEPGPWSDERVMCLPLYNPPRPGIMFVL